MKKSLLWILLLTLMILTGCFKESDNKNIVGNLILEGENEITLFVNDKYSEPGYSAINSEKENITKQVEVSGWNYDTSKTGEHELLYKIKDSNSEKAEVIRKIRVINFVENKAITESSLMIKQNLNVNESGLVVGFGIDIDKNKKSIAIEGNCFKEYSEGKSISVGELENIDQICDYDYERFKSEIENKKNRNIGEPKKIVSWGGVEEKAEAVLKKGEKKLIFIGIKREPVYNYYFGDVKLKQDAYSYYKKYNSYGFYKMYGNSYLEYAVTGGATVFYQEYNVAEMSIEEIESYRSELIKYWKKMWETDNEESLEVIYNKFEKHPKTSTREVSVSTFVPIGFSENGIRNVKSINNKEKNYVLNKENEIKTACLEVIYESYSNLKSELKLDERENWSSFFDNTDEILRRLNEIEKIQGDIIKMINDKKLSPLTNSEHDKFIKDCKVAIEEITEIITVKIYGYKNYLNELPNFKDNPYKELYERYNRL